MTNPSSHPPRDYISDPLIAPLLRVPFQAIRARVQARIAAAGYDDIGPAHFNILQHPTPDGMRPSEIAVRGQMSKQAANRLIRHLERRGYLALEADERDHRARIVRLTDKGWELIRAIRTAVEEVEAEWSTRLGPRKFETLRSILSELSEPSS